MVNNGEYLIGGLEHIYWEFHNPNWRTPLFFRGVGLNHQPADVQNLMDVWWFLANFFSALRNRQIQAVWLGMFH